MAGKITELTDAGTLTGGEQFEVVQAGNSRKTTLALVSAMALSYCLDAFATSFAPADASTYYFGAIPTVAPSLTAAANRLYIPFAGIIRAANIYIRCGVAGTSENFSVWVRLNNTTDYLITSTMDVSVASPIALNSAMNIPVVAGDYVEIKMTTPTWVTNPTSVMCRSSLFIQPL